jgi:uncharacterized C2H2 Zn-finger protein
MPNHSSFNALSQMSDNESVCSRRSTWGDKFDASTGKWACPDCEKTFGSPDALRKHSNRTHPVAKGKVPRTALTKDEGTGTWKCPYCKVGRTHATRDSLRKHVAQEHSSEPGSALKKANAAGGAMSLPAMGPPKSKVVVPKLKKTGVIAAMTRLAGYDVTPETDGRLREEEDEFGRARKAAMAAAAAAVLTGGKRPAKSSNPGDTRLPGHPSSIQPCPHRQPPRLAARKRSGTTVPSSCPMDRRPSRAEKSRPGNGRPEGSWEKQRDSLVARFVSHARFRRRTNS